MSSFIHVSALKDRGIHFICTFHKHLLTSDSRIVIHRDFLMLCSF